MCYAIVMKLNWISKWCLLAAGLFTCALGSRAAEGKWLTDYQQALTQAKQENKRVLIDFTGSDWCGWCIKFDKEVYSQQSFVDYADKNLVLLKLDFPQRKPLPAAQREANDKLARQYQVSGFPTTVVLDSAGKQLGKLVGYQAGGPQAFIAKLEKLK
jgi:protein disulfide-isomerase